MGFYSSLVGQAIRHRRTSYARGSQVTPEAHKLRQRRTGPTTARESYTFFVLIDMMQAPK